MKKMTKQLLSILLVFVLAFGALPCLAIAETPNTEDAQAASDETEAAATGNEEQADSEQTESIEEPEPAIEEKTGLSAQIAELIAAGDNSASQVIASGLTSMSAASAMLEGLTDDEARYAAIGSAQASDGSVTFSVVIYAAPQWPSVDELASEPMLTEDATFQSTLEEGWSQLKTSINLASFGISTSDFQNQYFSAIIDAPDFFNVRTYFSSAGYLPSTNTIISVCPSYVTTDSGTYESMKTKYEAAVSEALSALPNRATDLSKVYLLHDWLCDKASYDNDAASEGSTDGTTSYPTAFTSYGCMVEGSGVCQSYSLALSDLLKRAGVENTSLFVYTKGHAWNMAKVNGNWYHIDATWDDGSPISRKWFMKSDSAISSGDLSSGSSLTHTGWTSSSNLGWDSTMVASDTTYDNYDWSSYDSASDTKAYKNKQTKTSGNVTFTVNYDDPVAGEEMTFHLEATGGSDSTKYYMGAPSYYDTDGSYEVLCDPTYVSGYTSVCESYDYTFTPTASGTYWLEFNMMDTDAGVYYNRLKFSISINDAGHPSISAIVTNAVSQAKANTDGSDYGMALWLHDWLLDQLEYDNSLYWCSAESALTRGLGTCESYQRAYAKLLDSAGISNGRVEGNGHAWNAVKMDGVWYQVDPTWDDNGDDWYAGVNERHLYFGLTDELMAVAHSDHATNYAADGYGYRNSSELADNALVRSGEAQALAKAYASEIQQHLDAKERQFTVSASNTSWPPSIYGIVNPIVAYTMNQTDWGVESFRAACNSDGAAFEFGVSYTEEKPTYSITKQPSDVKGIIGSTVRFSVEAEGAVSYQWQSSTNGGVSYWNMSEAKAQQATVDVECTNYRIGRPFRCLVTFEDGSTQLSEVAYLSKSNNGITSQPKAQSASIGSKVKFSVGATGAVSYQWQSSTNGGKSYWDMTESTAQQSEVTVDVTNYRIGRPFRCKVTFEDGLVVYSDAAKLTEAKNAITKQPESVRMEVGSKIDFSVTAVNAKSYQWQSSTDGGKSWWDMFEPTAQKATVNVECTSYRMGRPFRCKVAFNDGSVQYSNVAYLNKLGGSYSITAQPKSAAVTVGGTHNFSVSATNVASYQWQSSTDGGKTYWNMSEATAQQQTVTVECKQYRIGRPFRCKLTFTDGSTTYTNPAWLSEA